VIGRGDSGDAGAADDDFGPVHSSVTKMQFRSLPSSALER
jgi:hypothetical protein